ncbi:hypothetical protein ACFL2V_17075 [Pseudomonadota bacterium]
MPNTPQTDPHGQPISRAFNHSRNREKTTFGLKDILEGVFADQRLTERTELKYI